LELLEEKVTEKVQEATTTVADTVESVSETDPRVAPARRPIPGMKSPVMFARISNVPR